MKARRGVVLVVRHSLVCDKVAKKWSASKGGAQIAVAVPPESVDYDEATNTRSIRVDRILDLLGAPDAKYLAIMDQDFKSSGVIEIHKNPGPAGAYVVVVRKDKQLGVAIKAKDAPERKVIEVFDSSQEASPPKKAKTAKTAKSLEDRAEQRRNQGDAQSLALALVALSQSEAGPWGDRWKLDHKKAYTLAKAMLKGGRDEATEAEDDALYNPFKLMDGEWLLENEYGLPSIDELATFGVTQHASSAPAPSAAQGLAAAFTAPTKDLSLFFAAQSKQQEDQRREDRRLAEEREDRRERERREDRRLEEQRREERRLADQRREDRQMMMLMQMLSPQQRTMPPSMGAPSTPAASYGGGAAFGGPPAAAFFGDVTPSPHHDAAPPPPSSPAAPAAAASPSHTEDYAES